MTLGTIDNGILSIVKWGENRRYASKMARSDHPTPPAAGEILTVISAGEGMVPRRRGRRARDRVLELTQLIAALLRADATIDQLAYRKSLEARAPASVKALANDLACYATFCGRASGLGLPADPARIVAYLEDCEARELKPASVERRLASLAVIHGLLGVPSPTPAPVVRDALPDLGGGSMSPSVRQVRFALARGSVSRRRKASR